MWFFDSIEAALSRTTKEVRKGDLYKEIDGGREGLRNKGREKHAYRQTWRAMNSDDN